MQENNIPKVRSFKGQVDGDKIALGNLAVFAVGVVRGLPDMKETNRAATKVRPVTVIRLLGSVKFHAASIYGCYTFPFRGGATVEIICSRGRRGSTLVIHKLTVSVASWGVGKGGSWSGDALKDLLRGFFASDYMGPMDLHAGDPLPVNTASAA